jgi:hypothetical protein
MSLSMAANFLLCLSEDIILNKKPRCVYVVRKVTASFSSPCSCSAKGAMTLFLPRLRAASSMPPGPNTAPQRQAGLLVAAVLVAQRNYLQQQDGSRTDTRHLLSHPRRPLQRPLGHPQHTPSCLSKHSWAACTTTVTTVIDTDITAKLLRCGTRAGLRPAAVRKYLLRPLRKPKWI